jgi:hypothetical protein
VARDLGVDRKTVGAELERMELTGDIPQSDERVGADGPAICTASIGQHPAIRRAPGMVDDGSEDERGEPDYEAIHLGSAPGRSIGAV